MTCRIRTGWLLCLRLEKQNLLSVDMRATFFFNLGNMRRLLVCAMIGCAALSGADAQEGSLTPLGWWLGSHDGAAFDVSVSGSHAYLAAWDDGLIVINLDNPEEPKRIGNYAMYGAMAIATSENYAYVGARRGGLVVFDIRNPSIPKPVGAVYEVVGPSGVELRGDYLYVADDAFGFSVINVIDPENPVHIARIDTDGWAYGVAVSGAYAFVADETNGLVVVDIKNPEDPTAVGRYADDGELVVEVDVRGDYAYLADSSDRFRVLDISDPTSPVLTGSCQISAPAVAVTITGNHAYLALGSEGLSVIDISDPFRPVTVGRYTSGGNSRNVAVSGRAAYLVELTGLGILQIDPLPPVMRRAKSMTGGGVGFTVSGQSGRVVAIQRSWGPGEWEDWRTVTLGEGVLEIDDQSSSGREKAFYRAVLVEP